MPKKCRTCKYGRGCFCGNPLIVKGGLSANNCFDLGFKYWVEE